MRYLDQNLLLKYVKITILILAIGVLGFTLITPLLPEMEFLLKQLNRPTTSQSEQMPNSTQSDDSFPSSAPTETISEEEADSTTPSQAIAQRVDEVSITIPSIQLDTSSVHSSHSEETLSKGIWHKKSTGDPFFGGNMVISAHRFMYLGSTDTFYHLPKIQAGEEIILQWGDQDVVYRVTDTFEVGPEDVWIMNHTKEHQLTLYTCTPMWTSDRRFVVQAEPVS